MKINDMAQMSLAQAMNSFNHYASVAFGAWPYPVAGGIDLDRERPGYEHCTAEEEPEPT